MRACMRELVRASAATCAILLPAPRVSSNKHRVSHLYAVCEFVFVFDAVDAV